MNTCWQSSIQVVDKLEFIGNCRLRNGLILRVSGSRGSLLLLGFAGFKGTSSFYLVLCSLCASCGCLCVSVFVRVCA